MKNDNVLYDYDTYVTVHTAIALKRLGFDKKCKKNWSSSISNNKPSLYVLDRESEHYNNWNDEYYTNEHHMVYSAPSQSFAQKWLREKFGRNIVIKPCISKTDGVIVYDVDIYRGGEYIYYGKSEYFDTYEDALEFGLLKTMEMITFEQENEKYV